MKKTSRRFGYFFLCLLTFSIVGFVALGQQQQYEPQNKQQYESQIKQPPAHTQVQSLPDQESTWFNAMFSALGGVGGCGLLLVFLIRRLVSTYDEKFAHWDEKNDKIASMIEGLRDRWDRREGKLQDMIAEIRENADELKIELAKIQINSVDKGTVMEALTRIALLEQNSNGCVFMKKHCGKDACNEV